MKLNVTRKIGAVFHLLANANSLNSLLNEFHHFTVNAGVTGPLFFFYNNFF